MRGRSVALCLTHKPLTLPALVPCPAQASEFCRSQRYSYRGAIEWHGSCVIGVLSSITYYHVVRTNLPATSYLTYLDMFCFCPPQWLEFATTPRATTRTERPASTTRRIDPDGTLTHSHARKMQTRCITRWNTRPCRTRTYMYQNNLHPNMAGVSIGAIAALVVFIRVHFLLRKDPGGPTVQAPTASVHDVTEEEAGKRRLPLDGITSGKDGSTSKVIAAGDINTARAVAVDHACR